MRKSKKKSIINRQIKDSVFTSLFGQASYKTRLLETLHPELEDVKPEEVETITLSNVLTNQFYNDLALRYKDKLLMFVEAQSTFNSNIPIRMLIYATDKIKELVRQANKTDIYGRKKLNIPKIELYCVCNYHDSKEPEYLYFGDDSSDIRVKVRMIYQKGTVDNVIEEYLYFTNGIYRIGAKRLEKEDTLRMMEEFIDECIDEGILMEYLIEKRSEVLRMIDIFTQEFAVERYGNEKYSDGYEYGLETGRIEGKVEGKIEGIKEGKIEGIKEGKIKGIAEIVKNYAQNKNISILQAIDELCIDESDLKEIKAFLGVK